MTNKIGSKSILVIDDHPDGAESLRDLLEMFGHTVEIAKTGEEGLQKIRNRRPDVVFCDWRLPGIGGEQVVAAVRSDPTIDSTFMVSLTAYDDAYTKQTALDSGFDIHLIKPPEVDVLERLLAGTTESTRSV